MAEKACDFIDFTVEVFASNVECSAGRLPPEAECMDAPVIVCHPRNMRMQAFGSNDDPINCVLGDPQRINAVYPFIVHVLSSHERIPADCIIVKVWRLLACNNGCEPDYTSVPYCWRGPGMMFPPGEYTFSIEEQVAHLAEPTDADTTFNVTLIMEPVTQDFVNAALYNATL